MCAGSMEYQAACTLPWLHRVISFKVQPSASPVEVAIQVSDRTGQDLLVHRSHPEGVILGQLVRQVLVPQAM